MAEETLNSVMANPFHVLFLNPSNNPNNILVSEQMNGENYSHWRKAMEVALIAKNKLGFVLGNCVKPASTSPLAAQWDRCDKMVISWLINVVVKDIGQSILFSSTAKDVWLQLEKRFGEVDSTKLFRVQRDLCLISQNNLSVADYFTQIKKLWDDYNGMIIIPHCNCGAECASLKAAHKLVQDQQLLQFLVGLNEDYKMARGSILMMKPLPDIDQVYNLILQEEKQKSLTAMSQFSHGSAAFNANLYGKEVSGFNHTALASQQRSYNSSYVQSRTNPNNSGYSTRYNQNYSQGNMNTNSNYRGTLRSGSQDRRQLYCDHCKMTGHTVNKCYKLHGYPPGHRLYKGRKVAAIAQTDSTEGHTFGQNQDRVQQVSQDTTPALTNEQYN